MAETRYAKSLPLRPSVLSPVGVLVGPGAPVPGALHAARAPSAEIARTALRICSSHLREIIAVRGWRHGLLIVEGDVSKRVESLGVVRLKALPAFFRLSGSAQAGHPRAYRRAFLANPQQSGFARACRLLVIYLCLERH